MKDRICENCGRWVELNEVLYQMSIVIQAEPGPEIVLEDPGDEVDLLDEIQKLVAKMEQMDEDDLDEATDQVHESYQFPLCPECRRIMHGRLKRRRGFMEAD